jgi:hypothetical protein
MKRRAIQAATLAVVMVCLGAHVSELFYTWDNSLQSGNDIEFSLVAVALCVGAAVVLVAVIRRLCDSWITSVGPAPRERPFSCPLRLTPTFLSFSSPPLLRI